MKTYIKESSRKARKSLGEYSILNKITVYVKDSLPDDIEIIDVIAQVEQRIPESLNYDVETVVIGDFPFLREREVESIYENGTIYVTNNQESDLTMVDDIVHELAHSLEANYGAVLYADKAMAKEYLGKKTRLLDLLKEHGVSIPNSEWYNLTEFDEDFDLFLYQQVGYSVLASISAGLFLSPYAVTDLREYLANGFEHFCSEEREYVKELCPVLYTRLVKLTKQN